MPRFTPKQMPTSLKLADMDRNTYVIRPPSGVLPADVQLPSYWDHVRNDLRKNDVVEVFPEDGSYYLRMFLWRINKAVMTWRVIEHKDWPATYFPGEGPDLNPFGAAFEVQWKGEPLNWCVIDRSDPDSLPIIQGLKTHEDAEAECNALTAQARATE